VSNYTQSTNFATKDALSPGDPLKIVRGTEINTEFANIAVAVATKLDTTALAAPGPIGATTPSTINATTGTFSGNVQMASANGGQLAGLRNRIINGDMRVAQRGSTTLSGVDTYGGCDRTFGGPSGFTTSSGNILQGGSLGGPYSSSGFLQSVLLTTTGTGIVRFGQKIEVLNTADLNGKQITISAKLTQDSGSALNATITVFRPTTTANDFSAQTLLATSSAVSVPSSSGSGTAITHTFTLGSTDASKGLAVYVTYAGVGAVTSKSFYIGDIQLEVGPVATPFEQIPIGLSLQLCQRYFEYQSNAQLIAYWQSTTAGKFVLTWSVPKRTTVSVTASGTWVQQILAATFASGSNTNIGTVTLTQYTSSSTQGLFDFTNTIACTTGFGFLFNPSLSISAEL